MAQTQNNVTTLLIPDPNGGQPQMIKVLSGTKLPFQITNVSGTSNIKTFSKTSVGDQPGTIFQTNKFGSRQLIAVTTKPGLTLQGIRNPMVVSGSSIQLKSGENVQHSTRIIQTSTTPTLISSPMVIRTQTGSLPIVSNNSGMNSISTPCHIQQMTINKPLQQTINKPIQQMTIVKPIQQTLVPAPILSAQLNDGLTTNRQMFTLKTQSINGQKQQELILLPPQQHIKRRVEVVEQQRPQFIQQQIPKVQILERQQPAAVPSPLAAQVISPPKSLMNSSILDHSGSRKRHDFDFDYSVESKRRKPDKGGKGLRHFSMKVCEKVQAKGTTSYNEVADELVSEFSESHRSNSPSEGVNYDQKNIRRRVYDALNVLMAMNIISKEKKEIHWLGLPTNSLQECHKLEQDRKKRLQKIKVKTQQLQDLILQQIAFKNLVERNRKMEEQHGVPSPNSAIQLPFIIVNTNKKTVIDCSISNDKTEYLFNFDDTFEIHDDIEVLKRRGMALGLDKGMCSEKDLEKAKSLVPKALERFVTELAQNPPDNRESKLIPFEEDLDTQAVSSTGEFTFEKIPRRDMVDRRTDFVDRRIDTVDRRIESGSLSSFAEEDDAMEEESDLEI